MIKKKIIAFLMSLSLLFILAMPAWAQLNLSNINENLSKASTSAGYSTSGGDLVNTIGVIIKQLLSFLGVIAVVLVIYGGFLWMTAGGETGQVDKAKNILKQAVIGLLIISLAYAITAFVFNAIQKAS